MFDGELGLGEQQREHSRFSNRYSRQSVMVSVLDGYVS